MPNHEMIIEQGLLKVNMPDGMIEDNIDLIGTISRLMAEKMIRTQEKYGWTNEWKTSDWEIDCRDEMMNHIQKGDPIDVVIYAAFMAYRGWSTSKAPIPIIRTQPGLPSEAYSTITTQCIEMAAELKTQDDRIEELQLHIYAFPVWIARNGWTWDEESLAFMKLKENPSPVKSHEDLYEMFKSDPNQGIF